MTSVLVYSGLTWNSLSESHCHNLTRSLAKDFTVFYLEVPYCSDKTRPHINDVAEVPIPDNVRLISAKKPARFGLGYLIKSQLHSLKSFFKYKKSFDVAILYNIYDVPFLLLCKIYNKKVIYAIVDDYPELTFNYYIHLLLKFNETFFLMLNNASFVTAQALLKKSPKSIYIPNTIRTNEPVIKHPIEKPVTTSYRVGLVGSIGKWIDTETINDVATLLPTVEFHIVGSGDKENELAKLPNMIKHGQVSKERVNELMQTFDVGLICFKINEITNSVSPIKLFEYFNAGLPVITSPTKELLQYKDIVFYYHSPQELAKLIKELKNNPNLVKSRISLGLDYIKKNNWEVIGEKYNKIITKVIN